MPRRKAQGINLQKKTVVVKSQNSAHIKKTLTFEKTKETNDCIKQSPIKTPNRVPELTTVSTNENAVETRNDSSYLHKKFKKVAGISDFTDKTEKTEAKIQNGYWENVGSCNNSVPNNAEERWASNNRADNNNSDGKGERTRSPLMKKDEVHLSANPGRYVCQYCSLACAKPSVLQKHIRAHTNERPYPCSPCGFAFKTKSNLYKHCRSQAHRVKAGEKCDDSGDEMSDDSNSTCPESTEKVHAKGSDTDNSENQYKIYKPKFHKLYIEEDREEERKEQQKLPKNLPPSPEFLQQHISKIISDNQAIVETMEPQWTKKFLQRQNSREKEMASPLSNVSSPGLDQYRNPKKDETRSKLALALLKVETSRVSTSYPKTEVNSDTQTYQPLNLTKKDSDDKRYQTTSGGSMIKEILIKSREVGQGQYSPEAMAEILSSLQNKEETYQCPKCKLTFNYENFNIHQNYYCQERVSSPDKEVQNVVEAPYLSPGPLLGTTQLVDVKTDTGPPPKKRRIQSTTIPPDPNLLYSNRRLSTSSLPSSNGLIKSPSRPSSSPSTTLKSLEELSKYPMKPSSLNMFGGEVKILDCGETKTMRIELNPNPASASVESSEENSKFFLTIPKTGLHSGGGTLVQVPATTTPQTNSFQIANILNYPDTTKLLMPLIPNISTPNLSVPGVPAPSVSATFPQKTVYNFEKTTNNPESKDPAVNNHNGGILTIVHGGKQIPYVPGIPGPQTMLPTKVTENIVHKKEETKKTNFPKETKSTVSSLISVRKLSSSNQQKNVPNEIPKIEISAPITESAKDSLADSKKDDLNTNKSKEAGLKFLRPTSLPLRPGSFTPKRLHQGITPTVLSLVSPETPRPKKSYGQLFLNGHAYTYLGLKCSTRSYYCTISRPQPMYVLLSPQHTKLSMYSNWKVYSDADPGLLGLTPGKAMALYDSRHRTSTYTVADKTKNLGSTGIVTHSSYWLKTTDKQSVKEDSKPETNDSNAWTGETAPKRVKIFAGGYESNEEYTYVRGRGRGRYVCEECGIRCKKPSMLKKHIRTHTDVRPYTCKHCSFSFKTKGNLTKHMKSKAHYKKCMEMNINPIPTTVEAENIDEELLVKQQALKQDGNDESENEDEEEDDESDGGDEEETTTDPESLEREAACSLLSLSETTPRNSQYKTLYIAAGLIPKTTCSVRPSTYPYTITKQPSSSPSAEMKIDKEVIRSEENAQFVVPPQKPEKGYDNESPIDLSQKDNSKNELNFLSKNSEFLLKSKTDPKKLVTTVSSTSSSASTSTSSSSTLSSSTAPVPAYLLASITNAGMQHDKLAADLTGSHMLQAYLTAKALHDVKIKQQQNNKVAKSFNDSNEPETGGVPQFDNVSQLHQNFCRIYEKTVENDTFNLKRFGEAKDGKTNLEKSKENQRKLSFDMKSDTPVVVENRRKLSLGDLNINKFLDLSKGDEDKGSEVHMKMEVDEKMESSNKLTEKSENVSVTVETSTGKMILVSFPSESDRSSPPTGFLAKSGDNKLKAEFFPPSSGPSPSYVSVTEDGRSICSMCNKIFTKASQLKLHVNIHYFERPFKCEACGVSFRTKGHLQKHERSVSHHNKVSMNTTFGTATTSNPRPFKCDDCKIAFRIHGHLAKHLRSKMHIMKLECIGKLPFGTYAEMERSGINLNEIDTTDCELSLESLQVLAQKLYEKDPSKLGQLENSTTKPNHSTNEDEVTNSERDVNAMEGDTSSSDGYQSSLESPEKNNEEPNELVCNGRNSIKKEVLQFQDAINKNNLINKKSDKYQKCTVCDEKFDNLTSLQVHLYAEHNRDMKIDNIEKAIKSKEDSFIDTEKGK